MFLLLSSFGLALKPIVFVPGTFGSKLDGTVYNRKTHWYCPKIKSKDTMWVKESMMIPPMVDCVIDWLTLRYDSKTGQIRNQDGVDVDIVDFSGFGGIEYLDDSFLGLHMLPIYSKYVKYLVNKGYEIKKNLFGCPFDWRRGLSQTADYWNNVRALVERAYSLNGNQKVVISGHSLGGYFVQHFLTEKTTAEWRAKYIDSAILIAPSFGGSGMAVAALWEGKIPFLELYGNDKDFAAFVSSLGGLHIHLLNNEVFGDKIVSYDPNGKPLKAKDLPEIYLKYGKLSGESAKLFEFNRYNSIKAPKPVDVPAAIIYNDALSCVMGIDMKTNKKIWGKGDHVVNAEGYQYACQNWKTGKKLHCHNINSTSLFLDHNTMVQNDQYVKYVWDLAMSDEWKK